MRLLLGFLILLSALVYFQNERSDCGLRGMSFENWLLCIAR